VSTLAADPWRGDLCQMKSLACLGRTQNCSGLHVWRPLLIALACSILLTGGSVFGVAATCNYGPSRPVTKVFFWMAVAGFVVVAVCIIWLIVLAAMRMLRGNKGL